MDIRYNIVEQQGFKIMPVNKRIQVEVPITGERELLVKHKDQNSFKIAKNLYDVLNELDTEELQSQVNKDIKSVYTELNIMDTIEIAKRITIKANENIIMKQQSEIEFLNNEVEKNKIVIANYKKDLENKETEILNNLVSNSVRISKQKFNGGKWFNFNKNEQLYNAFIKYNISSDLLGVDESLYDQQDSNTKHEIILSIGKLSREFHCNIFFKVLNKFYNNIKGTFVEKASQYCEAICNEKIKTSNYKLLESLQNKIFCLLNVIQDNAINLHHKSAPFTIINVLRHTKNYLKHSNNNYHDI